MKPLFIPLKREFFEAFCSGVKKIEFRKYGPRWNERTCKPGRGVILSLGYGKANRVRGCIVDFKAYKWPTRTAAWRKCYGEDYEGKAACITIRLDCV